MDRDEDSKWIMTKSRGRGYRALGVNPATQSRPESLYDRRVSFGAKHSLL